MDKFANLEAFVTVVECGSFSGASERLDVAKSAVSRRVGQLEDQLGSRLLNRTTRRLSLTEAGKVFFQQARQVLMDLDDAEQQVSDQQGSLRGLIRLAAPLSFGYLHLAPVLSEFMQRHPEIEMEVSLNDRYINLVEEGIDVAIRIGALEDSNLIARRIADIHLVTIASDAYLQQSGELKSPSDLQHHQGLEYSNLPRGSRWNYRDAQGHELSPIVPCRFRANNGNLLLTMAIDGLGVLKSPLFICGEALRQGQVRQVLQAWEEAPKSMYAVYPPGKLQSRRVRAFTDYLIDRFRNTTGWDGGEVPDA
ncbi:unnamed protein product [Cyprideis torosa]|uniref:Uncharacterized protein n=1 Tax=Cyprideis torosa TaxID=163714 RepID=A0A7R8ZZM9_9CRUS|nr:unnamed protein product [Cyprideis torosa]CAG0910046.1 unnamed protein product [Cyprideis torosa]